MLSSYSSRVTFIFNESQVLLTDSSKGADTEVASSECHHREGGDKEGQETSVEPTFNC